MPVGTQGILAIPPNHVREQPPDIPRVVTAPLMGAVEIEASDLQSLRHPNLAIQAVKALKRSLQIDMALTECADQQVDSTPTTI